jgi:hypothetical protein
MLGQLIAGLHASKAESLARTFSLLGWSGFWSQLVLGSIPLLLMLYVFLFSGNVISPRAALPLVEYLSLADLLLLLFLIVWFYRYTRIAKSLVDPHTLPSEDTLATRVWIGLAASSLGILFSLLVMLLEVGQLLFYFLAAPQGGIPAIQTTIGGSASWVSAVDLVSLLTLLLTLAAQVITLALGLWLLFRTTRTAGELAD